MQVLKRTFHTIENIALYICIVITLAMMFIITFDALGRYLFSNPISGSYELVEKYLMPALVFLGFNLSYKDDQQISIEVLYDRTAGLIRVVFDLIKLTVMILVMGVITYQGLMLTIDSFIDKRMDFGGVPIPLYFAYMWIPIGSGIMTIRLLKDFVVSVTKLKS